jgi:hypothetical protein
MISKAQYPHKATFASFCPKVNIAKLQKTGMIDSSERPPCPGAVFSQWDGGITTLFGALELAKRRINGSPAGNILGEFVSAPRVSPFPHRKFTFDSTLVLFLLTNLWYLHAIVRCMV